jgi:hypothetical protein
MGGRKAGVSSGCRHSEMGERRAASQSVAGNPRATKTIRQQNMPILQGQCRTELGQKLDRLTICLVALHTFDVDDILPAVHLRDLALGLVVPTHNLYLVILADGHGAHLL